ncbi:MAG: alkaline phosphatase family protein [Candidatus Brocadiales bacterium]
MAKRAKKKLLYIVLDGMPDGPHRLKELGGKTPLEAAHTPNLDSLARNGQTGLMHPVKKGIAPESDVAVISILGYDPFRYYTGRGPLESFAAGLKIKPGQLALRANFATKGMGRHIMDRRVGRSLPTGEAAALCKEINTKLRLESVPATFELKNTIGHRAVLVIRSRSHRLSGMITNTDPAYGREGILGIALEEGAYSNVTLCARPLKGCNDITASAIAALLVNEFTIKSGEILSASPVNRRRVRRGQKPANLILLRDAGDHLPKFPGVKKLFGRNFACLADMPVESGIARLTGMSVVKLPPPTSNLKKDYSLRVEKSLAALRKYDGIYVHIKGPDIPGHDGKAQEKVEAIEAIDRYYLGPVLKGIDLKNTVVAVTSDHTTPCRTKSHSHDAVPLVICGGTVRPDRVKIFTERTCKKGQLREIKGTRLMPLLVRYSR